MSWRAVAGWWLAAIVLVTIAVAWERVRPASGRAAAGAPQPVFAVAGAPDDAAPLAGAPAWPEGEARELVVERDGEPRRRFVRGEGRDWRQVEPIEHPVDPFSMERTIALARELRARDVIEAADLGDDAAETPAELLGLEPPRARLTVRWRAEEDDDDAPLESTTERPAGRTIERTIELGRRGIGGRAYARLAGDDRVLVVDTGLHDRAVRMDPKEWRERSIFGDVALDTLRSVELREGAMAIRLERERRRWRMAEPYATRLNPILLDELVGELAGARVAGFVLDRPDDLGRFRLDPPIAEVVVTVEEPGRAPRTTTLAIGAPAGAGTGDRFGRIDDRPVVVRIPGSVVRAIARPPQAWADPTATGTAPADVGRVRILSADREIVLERAGAGWTMAVGAGGDAPGEPSAIDPEGPDRLLDLLAEVRAPSVREGTLPPGEAVTVVLEDFGARPLHAVRIASAGEGEAWIMDAGDGLLRLYPAGIEPPLDPAALRGD